MELGLGKLLLIGGVGLLLVGWLIRQSSRKVAANNGSAAIGGDNNGAITITSSNQVTRDGASVFWTIWNIAGGFASFVGLALTIWPLEK